MLAPMMFSQPKILAGGNMLLSSHIRLRRLGDWLSRKENMASRLDTTDHGWIMLSGVYYFFPLLCFKINSLNYWPPGGMQAIYKSYLLVVASIPRKHIINLVYYSSQRSEINATSCHRLHTYILWLMVLTNLKNMKVNGKDEIPYIMENNPNVWNHQPVRLWDSSKVPSGKRLHSCRKSPFLIGKSTISMAIFNSFLYVYQRVYFINH